MHVLAERLGCRTTFSDQPREVFDELRAASAGGLADYAGIIYDRIANEQGVFWPCPDEQHPSTPQHRCAHRNPHHSNPAGHRWRGHRRYLQRRTTLDVDMVVVTAGICPNIGLAMVSGLETQRGIVVDDQLRSVDDDDIYAVGECVQRCLTTSSSSSASLAAESTRR